MASSSSSSSVRAAYTSASVVTSAGPAGRVEHGMPPVSKSGRRREGRRRDDGIEPVNAPDEGAEALTGRGAASTASRSWVCTQPSPWERDGSGARRGPARESHRCRLGLGGTGAGAQAGRGCPTRPARGAGSAGAGAGSRHEAGQRPRAGRSTGVSSGSYRAARTASVSSSARWKAPTSRRSWAIVRRSSVTSWRLRIRRRGGGGAASGPGAARRTGPRRRRRRRSSPARAGRPGSRRRRGRRPVTSDVIGAQATRRPRRSGTATVPTAAMRTDSPRPST